MRVNIVYKEIDDVKTGHIFKLNNDIWIKTNASHDKAGYQCVELERGNLSYIDKGTKVLEVDAEVRVFT